MSETTQIEKLNHFLEDMNYRYYSYGNTDLPTKHLEIDEKISSVAISCSQKNLIDSNSFDQIEMYASMSQEEKASSMLVAYQNQYQNENSKVRQKNLSFFC